MSDSRIIDIFNRILETLENDNPVKPKGSIHDLDYNLALSWFMMGYGSGFESQEDKINEMLDVLEFYAKPSTWGIDAPSVQSSVDPSDQELVENDHRAYGVRGGRRAREIIKRLFKEHADRLDF